VTREVRVRRFNSFAEADEADRESYRQMTPDQRVALVDELRRQFAWFKGEAHERLRRTVLVAERPPR
jgi:hypothetical protein